MEGLGVLLVVVAAFLANLPALREQWRVMGHGAGRSHQPERDGEFVVAAFLRLIGRGEVDGDVLWRERSARVTSGAEAAWAAADMQILAPCNLLQLVNHFKGPADAEAPAADA